MSTQSEHILEQELVKQLTGLDYEYVKIQDEDDLLLNLKAQLEQFNKQTYTNQEFDQILNHLSKSNVFEKAKTLRSRFSLEREDKPTAYVRFSIAKTGPKTISR